MNRRNERTDMSTFTPRKREDKRQPEKKAPPKPAVIASDHRVALDDMEKNVETSLASVNQGLNSFLHSIRQSGLPEAVRGYQAMATVVVQQRLWADVNRRDKLLPAFKSIADTSKEIHDVFSGFAEAMKLLRELDQIRAPSTDETPQT